MKIKSVYIKQEPSEDTICTGVGGGEESARPTQDDSLNKPNKIQSIINITLIHTPYRPGARENGGWCRKHHAFSGFH